MSQKFKNNLGVTRGQITKLKLSKIHVLCQIFKNNLGIFSKFSVSLPGVDTGRKTLAVRDLNYRLRMLDLRP